MESLHATHHHKHEARAHVIDYARGFGNTAKEGLKRTTRWAALYFTNKKSYYPVPSNSISFWDIPFLPPLPTVQMDDEDQERVRMGAQQRKKEDCSTRNHQVQDRHSPLNERKQLIREKYSLQSLLPMISMKPS